MTIVYGLVAALLGLIFYFCIRGLRVFVAWAQGDEPPREKKRVFAPLSALSFGVAGYLAPVDEILKCQEMGERIISCLI